MGYSSDYSSGHSYSNFEEHRNNIERDFYSGFPTIYVFVIVFIIFVGIFIAVCYCICRQGRFRRGYVQYSTPVQRPANTNLYGPSVTVTSTTTHQAVPVPSATAGVSPPYPVDPCHPTPHSSGAPAPGFSTHTPYPTNAPYHPQPGTASYPPAPGGAPYPPSTGAPYPPSTGAPYPPSSGAPYPPASSNAPYPPGVGNNSPPPYDVAVSQPPILPPTKEAYGKQSPYNPGYN